jgi:hypothetical protein
MNFVDKDALIQAGHSITDDYLNSHCRIDDATGSYHYQNVDYDGNFGDSGAKDAIQRLALALQDNCCCYCMRDLRHQNQQITLEHVIPQSASSEEFGRYTALGVHPLTDAELIRTADFTGVPNITIPPRPHTVTFENLMASCDGTFPDKDGTSQCCNHKRGNDFVYPMFYIASVRNEITYMEDGTMQPNANCAYPDEYRQTIVHTRLNCQNLKDIRKLWHLFASENYEVLVACVGDRNLRSKILMTVLFKKEDQSEADSKILCKFMKDDYWKTFLLYHWFYNRI